MTDNSPESQQMLTVATPSYRKDSWKVIRYTLAALLFLVLLIWGFQSQQPQWYDYGNGLVNLNRISLIRSNMSFTGVTSSGQEVELADAPITWGSVFDLESAISEKGPFERVRYTGKIMFDQFTITLSGFDAYHISYMGDDDIVSLAEAWLREVNRVHAQVQ